MQSRAITYSYVQSRALQSRVVECNHVELSAIMCSHVQSRVVECIVVEASDQQLMAGPFQVLKFSKYYEFCTIVSM